MRVLSEMDRFHIAKDAAQAVLGDKAAEFAKEMDEKWLTTLLTSVKMVMIFLKFKIGNGKILINCC